jgi:hypothetical protein
VTRPLRITWRSAALSPDSGLSSIARLAAAVYAEFANGEGVLDPAPSAATVAECMGTSDRWARKARRDLEAEGWLVVYGRPGLPSRIRFATPALVTGVPRKHGSGAPRKHGSEGPGTDLGTDLGTDPGTMVPPNKRNQKNQKNQGEDVTDLGDYTKA